MLVLVAVVLLLLLFVLLGDERVTIEDIMREKVGTHGGRSEKQQKQTHTQTQTQTQQQTGHHRATHGTEGEARRMEQGEPSHADHAMSCHVMSCRVMSCLLRWDAM